MCEVVVGRVNQTGSIYIGRGSVFGNPWSIEGAVDEYGVSKSVARDIVCDKFEEYFHSTLKHTTEFKIAIGKIVDNSVYGKSVILGCFCSPNRCHGETIKEYLEEETR